MKTPLILSIMLASCAIFPAAKASARTIQWSSAVGATFLKSNGVERWGDDLRFELGAFKLGFVPTISNIAQWEDNWLTFDFADAADGWNSTMGFLTSAAQARPATPGWVYSSADPAGATTSNLFRSYDGSVDSYQEAWIWAYNDKALGIGTEWALIGNTNWTFPEADHLNPFAVQFPLADGTALIGNLTLETHDDGYIYENLRTVSVQGFSPVAVPEAGGILLMSAGAFAFGFRRRRER